MRGGGLESLLATSEGQRRQFDMWLLRLEAIENRYEVVVKLNTVLKQDSDTQLLFL